VKVGVVLVLMVIVTEVVGAHGNATASGVKVYVTGPIAAVFTVAGFHVPVIFSFEVVGSVGAAAFWQTEIGIPVKVGVAVVLIVTCRTKGSADWPTSGVNV